MANAITATGLILDTLQEMIDKQTAAMRAIYGDDIILTQDTPDGQRMMIFIQAAQDLQDVIREVYNSMDPDAAFGVTLDRRVAYNGIQRKEGTYTVQPITISTSQSLTLYGINDLDGQDPYTVEDGEGNKWLLIDTVDIPAPAVPGVDRETTFEFRAQNPGAITTTPNSITIPVSIVLGVEEVNNDSIQTQIGVEEETDYRLKIRRQKSVSLGSQGYYEGLKAALENIAGVSSAEVYENDTGTTNSDGQPGHSIWVVIAGTPDPSEVANAIYRKRNTGASMFGDESYVVNRIGGAGPLIVRWSYVDPETLYVKFEVQSIDGVNTPNIAYIRQQLPLLLIPQVNGTVDINQLGTFVRAIDSNALVINAGFGYSELGPFQNVLSPSAKDKQFILESENVIITPIILSPASLTIDHENNRTFIASGGFGVLTFTLDLDDSGGNITADGFYTAGAVYPSNDVVRVTDELGNYATANVVVS